MTDEDLKTFLPSYGDCLAVLGFCRRKEYSHNKTGKSKLFERLKSKLSKRKPNDEGESSKTQGDHSQPTVKKNAMKTMRQVEIGWMHYDDETEVFKQVRAKRGGGTRKVTVSKDAQKMELIQEGVGLFFPNGRNRLGPSTHFKLDLKKIQELTVDEELTVGQLYTDTKLPLLRFYLTTQKKENDSPQSQTAGLTPPLEREVSVQDQSSSLGVATAISFETISSDMVFLESTTEDNFDLSLYPSGSGYEDVLENSNIVFIGDIGENEHIHLDDTLPLSPPTMPSSEHKRILVVHRGQVLRELIAHFCDEELQEVDFNIKHVLPDGKAEMAYDDGGVVRDCLSEFWKEFYEQCTMGNTFRVPFLRHDFGEKQWESVGRIIAFGWARAKYLPEDRARHIGASFLRVYQERFGGELLTVHARIGSFSV